MSDENAETDVSQNLDDSSITTMTLKDVLEFEDNMIEDTAAVLGAINDKCCTYNEGYLKRQALYSCLTCIPEAKDDPEKAAGVCLACSYHCHDGHDLVELYTKRSFRCDCGNKKFPEAQKCTLNSEKDDFNELNVYNQNFSGKYCVCHRPYPDPEDPVPDEMVQCIICEDWYHARHLGTEVPSENFGEMICQRCIVKHEFLLHYDALTTTKVLPTNEDTKVDIEGTENNTDNSSEIIQCKKPKIKSEKVSAKFWQEFTWRKQLCTCDDCLKMYENEDVAFLLDNEDPVHLYEEKGKEKAREMVEESERKMLNSMNRIQQIEVIQGYNDLKENLGEFLKKFCENKKVVREEDIREFFEGMKARKKQKVEIPYHCH